MNVPITMDNLAGFRDGFESAMADVAASLADGSLDGRRTITLKIGFEPKGAHVITSVECKTSLPSRTTTGVAWNEHGVLVTEERCLPGDGRQMSHPVLVAGGKKE